MRQITLGTTGITVPQNAFGALPIQRISAEKARALVLRAHEGGMRFIDTARSYSDSEEKLGPVMDEIRDDVFLATKTQAKDVDQFWSDLETSLKLLHTDHIDVYQFHNVGQCYKPGDGTGMYEAMLEAKAQGKIKHIGITTHLIGVAFEIVESGLYETLQFPFSYLASEDEFRLVQACKEHDIGFIAMKALAGGLLTNSRAIMAFMDQYDVLPIWGIQREHELDEWLSYMNDTPALDDELRSIIDADRKQLMGEFCRGCGYCLPACVHGIKINDLARMSLMLRRAPAMTWLAPKWQDLMSKVEFCTECRACQARCPYSLDVPRLLRDNYDDYKAILAGKVDVFS